MSTRRPLALFGTRAGAWVIDAIPHALLPSFVGRLTGSTAYAVAAFLVVGILWSIVPEARGGRTPGKLLTGLRTVRADGEGPLGLGRAGLRWAVKYLVGGPFPVSYLWSLRDPRRRTWHDLAAGTVVVDLVSGDRRARTPSVPSRG